MAFIRALLIVLVAAGGVDACSQSSGAAKSDASRDGTGSADHSPSDRMFDASGGSDSQDAGAVCFALDASTGPRCAATWAEAVAYPACLEQPDFQIVRSDCGAFHLLTQFGVDSNRSCVYEIASGRLVAGSYSNSSLRYECWGPPSGIPADCSNSFTTTVCPIDGGTLGDGGGGNCLSVGSPPFFSWNAPCPGDGGTPCYANCSVVADSKYVGCVSESSVATMCYASCSECP